MAAYTNEKYLISLQGEEWAEDWVVLEEYRGAREYINYLHKPCGTIIRTTPKNFRAKRGNCTNSNCIDKKKKQTYFEKTGYENPSQNPEIQKKKTENYFEKTGYKSPSQNPEVQEKMKQTNLKRTGYENPAQNPEIQRKMKDTNFEKTGHENPAKSYNQRNKTKDQIYWSDNTLTLILLPENQGKTLQWWIEKRGDKTGATLIKLLNKEENRHLRQFIDYNKFKGPEKIKEILDSLEISWLDEKRFEDCKDIKSLPFDFYLPDFNLLIEYDGEQHFESIDVWGGKEKFETQQKHDKIKTQYATDNNIKLLRIPYWDYGNIEEILLKELT